MKVKAKGATDMCICIIYYLTGNVKGKPNLTAILLQRIQCNVVQMCVLFSYACTHTHTHSSGKDKEYKD